MLLGGAIGPAALVAGAMLATAAIVALCVFLNRFRPISDFLQSIPLVCITTTFAVFLIVKVATMH